MRRRKFLIGAGSFAAAGAGAIGTGAFTSVEADRTVDVEVAGDANAYLALEPVSSSPNSAYVDTTGGEVSFDFSSSNGTSDLGDGFNKNAVTEIDDLLRVTNQGTQSAYLSADLSDLDLSDGAGNEAKVGVEVVTNNSNRNVLNENIAEGDGVSSPGDAVSNPTSQAEDDTDAYELTSGSAVIINLIVDTTDFTASDVSTSGTVTFIADQDSDISDPTSS